MDKSERSVVPLPFIVWTKYISRTISTNTERLNNIVHGENRPPPGVSKSNSRKNRKQRLVFIMQHYEQNSFGVPKFLLATVEMEYYNLFIAVIFDQCRKKENTGL